MTTLNHLLKVNYNLVRVIYDFINNPLKGNYKHIKQHTKSYFEFINTLMLFQPILGQKSSKVLIKQSINSNLKIYQSIYLFYY